MTDPIEEKLRDLFTTAARQVIATEAQQTLDPNPLASWQVDFKALFDGEHEDEQWLLEPFLARGRAHALYAGAKVGKSWVMLYLAAALASGRPVLRKPAGDPVHILYVDYEMTGSDLADRLEDFGYGPDDADVLNEHLHYVLLPSIPALDTEEGGDILARAAVATGAELVVIDTMMRAVEGEENASDTFNAFYRHTGLRLKALGVTWARLDHAGKDPTKGQRGSSAKDGDVDLVLRLDRVEGGVTVKATHRRIGWYPELTKLVISPADLPPVTMALEAGDARTWSAGTGPTAATLDRLGVPIDATARQALDALRKAGEGVRKKVVLDALAWRREPSYLLGNRPGNRPVAHSPVDDGNHLEPPTSTSGNRYGNRWEPGNRQVGTGFPPLGGTGTQATPEAPELDTQEDPW